MITILHGENISLSRNELNKLKVLKENSVNFDNKNISFSQLVQVFNGGSLFSSNQSVFIENLLSSKKNISEIEKLIDLIKKNSKKFDIVLWEGSELALNNLYIFKDAKIEVFKLPQNLFSFLDNIKPSSSNNLTYFHNALKTSGEEMIFYMLVRQFRLLSALNEDSSVNIDEIKRLNPWQRQKLEKQLSLFPKEKLKEIYNRLFTIDSKIKVGEIADFTTAIDFFLLDL